MKDKNLKERTSNLKISSGETEVFRMKKNFMFFEIFESSNEIRKVAMP